MVKNIDGYCICPQCGIREPHIDGYPCFRRACAACGSMMQRDDGNYEVAVEDEEKAKPVKVDGKPVVDRSLCISCGVCIESCPANAIIFRGGKAFVLADQCTECGTCSQVCPSGAIK